MNIKEERPPIKSEMKRAIRKEAHYGCVKCGNPIIEYHHIEPYHEVLCHEVENLIALCPTHHYKADRGMISKQQLYQLKKKPFNSVQDNIKDDVFIGNYDNLEFKTGPTSFIRTPNLFVVDNVPLISVTKDESNNAVINAKFFDSSLNLIAEIQNNEWITYLKEEIWDIQYAGGKLKINSGKGVIFLEFLAKPENNYVELRANMYYKNCFFNITPSKITYGFDKDNPKDFSGMMLGVTMVDCMNGIVLLTSEL
ncbi:HNH endonuclease signature motif containing protein [Priestia megaterium]|uniref:HNH endonuclease signature motif containing protein n=1 Tax=Priestia megaterium TaxID=1404 RepID=UPI0036726E4D